MTAALLALLGALSLFLQIPWWGFTLVLLTWFLITLGGSFFVRWNYHLTSLHSNKDIQELRVSLTFDDGPDPDFTPLVLDLLKQHHAKATFFCIGQQVEKHPEILERLLSEGHTVGNHTYTHSRSFGFFGVEKVAYELKKTRVLVQQLTGKEMKLYRPAFAVTNPMIEKAVRQLNLTSIGWNVRSLDTTKRKEKIILKRITSRLSKGDVVLLHDTSKKTVAVLEQLLLFLKQENLKSVTVDGLLNIEPYA